VLYRSLGDFVALLHLTFIVFALTGGVLVSRWHWLAWLHVPCMGWIALNQCFAWSCPLTLAEKWFKQQAGVGEYQGGFVSHYAVPLLGREGEAAEPLGGLLIIALNGILYWWTLKTARKSGRDD
jgi:Protein of Unknown function (DUF2784)